VGVKYLSFSVKFLKEDVGFTLSWEIATWKGLWMEKLLRKPMVMHSIFILYKRHIDP
jgi:hypothetical protein